MTTAHTRRALIGGAGLATIVVVAPAVAMAPKVPGVTPVLAAMIDRARQASATANRYNSTVYEPLRKRVEAARNAVPHVRALAKSSQDEDEQAARKQNDILLEVALEAMNAIGAYPVATPADLHAKLAFMVSEDMGSGVDWLADLLADAARVAKLGA